MDRREELSAICLRAAVPDLLSEFCVSSFFSLIHSGSNSPPLACIVRQKKWLLLWGLEEPPCLQLRPLLQVHLGLAGVFLKLHSQGELYLCLLPHQAMCHCRIYKRLQTALPGGYRLCSSKGVNLRYR